MFNEIITTIMTRASVRRFTEEPVSDSDLQTLLQAAMTAPSAMDYAPWHFVVIRDAAIKQELKAKLPFAKMITDSCTAIVVCGDSSLYDRVSQRDGEDNTLYWVEDCSAASENLLLAAHALGLGAVWTGIFPLQSRITLLQRLLQLPERILPLNLILVGHPLAPAKPKDKWDVAKVHYNHF